MVAICDGLVGLCGPTSGRWNLERIVQQADKYDRCPARGEIKALKKIVENGLTHKTAELADSMAKLLPRVQILWKMQWWQIGIMVGLIGAMLFSAYEVVTNIVRADKALQDAVTEMLRRMPNP